MNLKRLVVLAVMLSFTTVPVAAGPPLICHPVDIGSAPSLPWRLNTGWDGMLAGYDVARLAAQTLAAIDADSPVDVVMETLRRAAIYSSRDPRQADLIAERLHAQRSWFALGFFIEGVREATYMPQMLDPASNAAWKLRALTVYCKLDGAQALACVETRLRSFDFVDVCDCPLAERGDGAAERHPERRQRVFHPRGNFGVDRPHDQTVALEIAQGLRQHFLGDALDVSAQLVETVRRAVGEQAHHHHGPLVGDAVEDQPDRAIPLESGGFGELQGGFHLVPIPLLGAYL